MANDLIKIVKDTERSLVSYPAQYGKQMEAFVGKDEKILSAYITAEREQSPITLRYSDWEMLSGSKESYTRPKRHLQKAKKQYPELERKINKLVKDSDLEGIFSSRNMDVFGNLPRMIYQIFEMITNRYESIVAYAKQLGEEQNIRPEKLVKSAEARKEIDRRTFGSKEQYEWYNNACAETTIAMMGFVYKMIEYYNDEMRDIPLVGRFLCWSLDRKLKKVPPKAVSESFIRDSIDYYAKKADDIFGPDYSNIEDVNNPRVIEPEIID